LLWPGRSWRRQPVILISGDGRNVAVRGRDGRLHLLRTGKDAFLIKARMLF